MKPRWKFLAVVCASWTLAACSPSQEVQKDPGNQSVSGLWSKRGEKPSKNRILRVTDLSGQPIAQAQILIGESLDQPFASNFITTDSTGSFPAPAAWTSAQVVTIAAKGFVRATYFDQLPSGQTFVLRPAEVATQYELKGQSTGFQVKDGDNQTDFALMMLTVQKQDLFAFNINMFISPQIDVVDVFGQKINIPSNVSLPRQKERYGPVQIVLNKPAYRMYFDALGMQNVVTLRGQFPFKEVVDEMRGKKPFIELINYFSIKGGSLKKVQITGPTQSQDLPVDELAFNQKRGFHAPAFASDEFLVAAALSPYEGKFFPTDFKNVPANTASTLTTAAGEPPQLLVALKKKSEQNTFGGGKLSAAFVPFRAGVRPELLPMIENPQVTKLTEISLRLPQAPSAVVPTATYLILSSVEKRGAGADATESVTRLWEVYASEWKSDFVLPQWPGETITSGGKRWEVNLLGTQNVSNKGVDLSPRILETVTHATHSATDF